MHLLRELGKSISRNVVVGGIGLYAVDNVDCYYLVRWIDQTQEVEEDGIVMVEKSPVMLFRGDLICRGIWLDQVSREKIGYTVGQIVVIVRMKSVLVTDLLLSPISEEKPFPRVHPSVREQLLPLHPHKLHVRDHDYMMDEIERRESLNADENIDKEGTTDEEDDGRNSHSVNNDTNGEL